ncbi:MAG: hypothetical protein IPJ37_24580 [Bacteroidales bacterium]|nr:hypothetical protein [Bacteroidales bacterium]
MLYRAEIVATLGNSVKPELSGMCLLDSLGNAVIKSLSGITTASEIFDEMNIIVSKPRPRIIDR